MKRSLLRLQGVRPSGGQAEARRCVSLRRRKTRIDPDLMLEEAPMIDVAKITPTALEAVQPGEFFVPVVQGENRFLGGRLGQTPVLVMLDGEDPFNTAEH